MWLPSMTVGPPTLPVTETAPVTVLPPRTTGPVLPLSDTAPVWVFPAQAAPSYAGTGQVGLQLAGLVHGGGFGYGDEQNPGAVGISERVEQRRCGFRQGSRLRRDLARQA